MNDIKVTSVSDAIPFDPALITATPSNGTAIVYDSSTGLFTTGSVLVAGVTPPFLFSRAGSVGLASYLQVGNVYSNQTGQIIPGSNYLNRITVSTSQVAKSCLPEVNELSKGAIQVKKPCSRTF